jgi:hypothetical protein
MGGGAVRGARARGRLSSRFDGRRRRPARAVQRPEQESHAVAPCITHEILEIIMFWGSGDAPAPAVCRRGERRTAWRCLVRRRRKGTLLRLYFHYCREKGGHGGARCNARQVHG